MRPVTVAIPTGANPSTPVPLDVYQRAPVTVGVTQLTGTLGVTIQFTMDDVFSPTFNPATAVWFPAGAPLDTVAASKSAQLVDSAGHSIVPRAVRALNSTASTGLLTISQAGVMG